jgi:hypothetical protein
VGCRHRGKIGGLDGGDLGGGEGGDLGGAEALDLGGVERDEEESESLSVEEEESSEGGFLLTPELGFGFSLPADAELAESLSTEDLLSALDTRDGGTDVMVID